jgi:hypothetical protein
MNTFSNTKSIANAMPHITAHVILKWLLNNLFLNYLVRKCPRQISYSLLCAHSTRVLMHVGHIQFQALVSDKFQR